MDVKKVVAGAQRVNLRGELRTRVLALALRSAGGDSSPQGSARDHDGLMVSGAHRHQPPDLSQASTAKVFTEFAAQECMRQAAVVANRPPRAATAHDKQMLIVGPPIPMPIPVLECQALIARGGGERLGHECGVLAQDT